MARASTRGDTHNFGRRVVVHGDWVEKPRTVAWEWLLLSPASPLRRTFARPAFGGAFDFLPSLRFERPRAREGARVERIQLAPLRVRTAHERRTLAEVAGRALALFAWLGLADLHWENLVLGADARGRTIFGPLDVEMILDDLALPTETKLVPDAAPDDPELAVVLQHAAGMRRFLPWLGKPIGAGDLVALADAYLEALALLDRHGREIALAIGLLPSLETTPIRVLLRGTDAYARASFHPPLLAAEAVQLARGDVPWFFRLVGTPGIFHYGDRALRTRQKLPTRGDVPRLPPLLSLAKHLRSPKRTSLREEGLFAVLAAFDHPTISGTHRTESLEVDFRARSLRVTLADGTELSVARPVTGVVSSLYQPCTCGEVRTALVPAVTRCSLGVDRGATVSRRGGESR